MGGRSPFTYGQNDDLGLLWASNTKILLLI
jgi:hypothetical protein